MMILLLILSLTPVIGHPIQSSQYAQLKEGSFADYAGNSVIRILDKEFQQSLGYSYLTYNFTNNFTVESIRTIDGSFVANITYNNSFSLWRINSGDNWSDWGNFNLSTSNIEYSRSMWQNSNITRWSQIWGWGLNLPPTPLILEAYGVPQLNYSTLQEINENEYKPTSWISYNIAEAILPSYNISYYGNIREQTGERSKIGQADIGTVQLITEQRYNVEPSNQTSDSIKYVTNISSVFSFDSMNGLLLSISFRITNENTLTQNPLLESIQYENMSIVKTNYPLTYSWVPAYMAIAVVVSVIAIVFAVNLLYLRHKR